MAVTTKLTCHVRAYLLFDCNVTLSRVVWWLSSLSLSCCGHGGCIVVIAAAIAVVVVSHHCGHHGYVV